MADDESKVTVSFDEAVALAVRLHREGRAGEAETLYERLLGAAPDHPDLLHFLGILRHQQGRSDEGIERIRRSIRLRPSHPDFRNNLGNVFREMERFDEAAEAYEGALEQAPGHADAHNNLGIVCRIKGEIDEAIAHYESAVESDPAHRNAHFNLGNICWAHGRPQRGLEAYERAVELDPANDYAYRCLGVAYVRAGRPDRAAALYERWLKRDPDNSLARHMLAACRGGDRIPRRTDDAAVRSIFDGFAASFDDKLARLGYRAPELLGDSVAGILDQPDASLEVLDAGCGTGLCAPSLKPYARRLDGVDLSPGMLAKARRRGGYDRLFPGELTRFMEERPCAYDLIVSADTLCYFGDLARVITAAFRCLKPGGLLAFSVELEEGDGDAGYTLHPHGRYAHREGYVRAALGEAGFGDPTAREAELRSESGRPVPGLVVTAVKRDVSANRQDGQPLEGPAVS